MTTGWDTVSLGRLNGDIKTPINTNRLISLSSDDDGHRWKIRNHRKNNINWQNGSNTHTQKKSIKSKPEKRSFVNSKETIRFLPFCPIFLFLLFPVIPKRKSVNPESFSTIDIARRKRPSSLYTIYILKICLCATSRVMPQANLLSW